MDNKVNNISCCFLSCEYITMHGQQYIKQNEVHFTHVCDTDQSHLKSWVCRCPIIRLESKPFGVATALYTRTRGGVHFESWLEHRLP